MIINIRGTSGSGKSTIVRNIMAQYETRLRVMRKDRKQPFGYICNRAGEGRSLAVIGHYETACGGCDTINKMDDIFAAVRISATAGHDVLFEGLLIAADVNRVFQLRNVGDELKVYGLTTDIDTCIASVNERRQARNPDLPPVKTKNTISKHRGVIKSMDRLKRLSVDAAWGTRDEVYEWVLEDFGLER